MDIELIKATIEGDLEKVKQLVQKGANVNYKQDGLSALSFANQTGNIDMILYLLKQAPLVREASFPVPKGRTLSKQAPLVREASLPKQGADDIENTLKVAVSNNYFEVVKYLIKYINNKYKNGETPLIWAVNKDNIEMVKYLIKNNADVNVVTNYGVSPLLLAIKNNNYEMVKLLLKYGAKDNKSLIRAIEKNNSKIVKLLIESGVNINDTTPLIIAIDQENIDIVKLLIKYGVDINYEIEQQLPLKRAILRDNFDIVKLLVDNGANVNQSLLLTAITKNNPDIVKLLLNTGVDKTNILNKIELNPRQMFNQKYCDNLKQIIELLGYDVDDTINYLQGSTPKPLCEKYKSGRGKLAKGKVVRAIGKVIPTKINKQAELVREACRGATDFVSLSKQYAEILSDFEDIIGKCYCLIHDFGVFDNIYIPVSRYGEPEKGYYGPTPTMNANFTWYYLEPNSEIYLYSPKTLITKNKITALIELQRRLRIDLANLKQIVEYEIGKVDDTIYDTLLQKEKVMIDKSTNNYFETTDGEFLFADGQADYLDEDITNYSRELGIDVVVLTHQSGSSGRLVSECVDNRLRSVSYSNLYYLD
jgi:ankyrin repeat protein